MLEKITFVIGNLGVGGTEKQLYQLLKGFDILNKYQISVVLFNKNSNKYIYKNFEKLKSVRLISISTGLAIKKLFL